MNEKLYRIIDGLIAQNHRLGQKQVAMECVCSALLAQIALLSPEPRKTLDRINSELCGTAMGVAAQSSNSSITPDYDTQTITATIETVAVLSEQLFVSKQITVSVPAWA